MSGIIRLQCLIVIALAPAVATAGMIFVNPLYTRAYDSNFTPLAAGTPIQPGMILQIDVRMSVTGLAAAEDFLGMSLNVALSSGLQAVDNGSGKWMLPAVAEGNGLYTAYPSPLPAMQNYGLYDGNGAAIGGVKNHWQTNADLGANQNDLQGISIEASASEAANRQYGEAVRPAAGYADQLGSPTLVGTFLVRYNGPGLQSITLSSIGGSDWLTYINNAAGNGTSFTQPAGSYFGGQLTVPEPDSLVLALLAFGIISLKFKAAVTSQHPE
jgi:hypothetical protein